jgi:AAA domain
VAKSALSTDLAVHVATGQDWRGKRSTGRCGVIYFALERVGLLKRRLVAYRKRGVLSLGTPLAFRRFQVHGLETPQVRAEFRIPCLCCGAAPQVDYKNLSGDMFALHHFCL